jgi:hypothetical protein
MIFKKEKYFSNFIWKLLCYDKFILFIWTGQNTGNLDIPEYWTWIRHFVWKIQEPTILPNELW